MMRGFLTLASMLAAVPASAQYVDVSACAGIESITARENCRGLLQSLAPRLTPDQHAVADTLQSLVNAIGERDEATLLMATDPDAAVTMIGPAGPHGMEHPRVLDWRRYVSASPASMFQMTALRDLDIAVEGAQARVGGRFGVMSGGAALVCGQVMILLDRAGSEWVVGGTILHFDNAGCVPA